VKEDQVSKVRIVGTQNGFSGARVERIARTVQQNAWVGVKALFAVTLAGAVLLSAAKRPAAGPTAQETVLPALVHPGAVQDVAAGAPGKITAIHVQPGAWVEEGALLAEIENSELESDLDLARGRLSAVRKRMALEGSAGVAPRARLKAAEAQLKAALRARDSARNRMKAISAEIDASGNGRAHQMVQRVRDLAAKRLATAAELDAAELAAENERRAGSDRRDTRSRIAQEAEAAEGQVTLAQLQIDTLRAGSGSATDIDVREAESAIAKLERRIAALRVTAPRAGQVSFVNASDGGAAVEGLVLFRINDSHRLLFEVSAPPSIARDVRQGDPVTVRVPLDPPVEVEAKVDEVVWTPHLSHGYSIRVRVDNPDPAALVAGLEGSVGFRH